MEDFSDIVIVTDLDGTFFGKPTCIVERNMTAIDWLKARGGKFTIATGRMHHNMRKPIPNICELVNAPIIACNGALLYDIINEKTISENIMDYVSGFDLIKYTIEHFPSVGIRVSFPGGFITTPEMATGNKLLRSDIEKNTVNAYRVMPLDSWTDFKWYKFVFRGEPEVVDRLREEVEPRYSDTVSFSKSGPKFFEAQGKGVNKALPLPVLREYCGEGNGKKITLVC